MNKYQQRIEEEDALQILQDQLEDAQQVLKGLKEDRKKIKNQLQDNEVDIEYYELEINSFKEDIEEFGEQP